MLSQQRRAPGPIPPGATSSPVIGRTGALSVNTLAHPQGGIITGHVEHGTTQGVTRGRYGSGGAANSNIFHIFPVVSHTLLLDRLGFLFLLAITNAQDGDVDDGIGRPDIRRSSAEERVCSRCNTNVKSNIAGMPPNFHTCSMRRTSLCSACCPPLSGNCSLCAIVIGRDGVLPPHVFGQATTAACNLIIIRGKEACHHRAPKGACSSRAT